jgi:hypothetical protein
MERISLINRLIATAVCPSVFGGSKFDSPSALTGIMLK